MKKAVIYARYSSERQTEQSIEGQLRVCNEFAEKEEIIIVNSYIDRAISGKTDNRPAFQQMISDSSHHEFDYVLVYKLDRFARNRYDSAMYKNKLKKNGVKVISAMENITDSPEGIILEGLLEAMNEYYSAELSQKIKRGMRESRLKGQVTGGNPATGYDIGPDKRLVINERQAESVKMIFEMYCNGSNFSEICKVLNSQGYRTSRNKEFRSGTISRILRNRHYIGEMGDEGVKNCPVIVDEETFRKANERLDEHTSHRKHNAERADYMLTPKIYCGKCGKRMTGRAGTSKTKNMYYYYSCGTVDDEWIKKNEIESIVIKSISEYLTEKRIRKIAVKAHKIYISSIEENREVRLLEKELKQTEKAIANIISAIEQGIFTSLTKKRLDELEIKKQEIETGISVKKINAPDLKPEHFEVILKKYINVNADNNTICRALIESLIDKVVIYPDKIVITLNITKTPNSLETISEAVESSHIVSLGGGHRTGEKGGNWNELHNFVKLHYPNAKEKYHWAAQDGISLDEIPYIGKYSRNTPNLYVAGGFNKWGMTSAMVSAMIFSDIVMGRRNEYADIFSPSRNIIKPQLFINCEKAIKNLLIPTTKRCPHMGCVLKWNSAEHSWDCACHGSRFSDEGKVLDNPANGDLK